MAQRVQIAANCNRHLVDDQPGRIRGPRLNRRLATLMFSKGGKRVEGNLREFAAMAEADWANRQGRRCDAPVVELTAQEIRGSAGSGLGSP